jgi:uncharacterized protein YbaP (TraB family)
MKSNRSCAADGNRNRLQIEPIMSKQSTRLARLRGVLILLAIAAVTHPLVSAAAPRNFFWKATSRAGTVYLVGSVHVLSKDYYPLNPALEAAFKQSGHLVEEVDPVEMMGPMAQMTALSRGMLPAGQSLEKVISASTFAMVVRKAEALGVPIEPLKQFKPWSLGMMIESLELMKSGFQGELGLDFYFADLAKRDGKSVQGLETMEFQLSTFDDMPMAQQDRMLFETLQELDDPSKLTRMVQAWQAGDAAAVERLAIDDLRKDPDLYRKVLVDRNRNWLPKIEALFDRREPVFVCVGAAHLVGSDGLVAMLKAKGYSVEQQ